MKRMCKCDAHKDFCPVTVVDMRCPSDCSQGPLSPFVDDTGVPTRIDLCGRNEEYRCEAIVEWLRTSVISSKVLYFLDKAQRLSCHLAWRSVGLKGSVDVLRVSTPTNPQRRPTIRVET